MEKQQERLCMQENGALKKQSGLRTTGPVDVSSWESLDGGSGDDSDDSEPKKNKARNSDDSDESGHKKKKKKKAPLSFGASLMEGMCSMMKSIAEPPAPNKFLEEKLEKLIAEQQNAEIKRIEEQQNAEIKRIEEQKNAEIKRIEELKRQDGKIDMLVDSVSRVVETVKTTQEENDKKFFALLSAIQQSKN
jgi:hypothetical protein